jgi:hypothetical protein
VLGLEVDGVTGQAYLIPFKGKAQLVVGYKGYNTLAARSGITITGEWCAKATISITISARAGFEAQAARQQGAHHRAWAKAAASNGRPPVVKVMSIDELMAVKAKSPGARAATAHGTILPSASRRCARKRSSAGSRARCRST